MAMRWTRNFSTNRLSLVDRGFVYAIAHVRGGTEKGWGWYVDGKLAKKTNTFADFIACARHLIAEGYRRQGRIVAHGGSAGGMLMGAIANMRPNSSPAIIADVPFVDVLNTMLDDQPAADPAGMARMGQSDPRRRGLRDDPRLQPLRQCRARSPIRRSWRSPA